MGPSFLEGGPIMCWSCSSVCLSVPCLHLEGKQKGLWIPNLVGRVSGTPIPRGPISRSRGQRSRLRRLIALLVKNPHNFAACCPINLILGRWRKDPLPPCTDLESPKTACTYSTARTAPWWAAPQRLHPLVLLGQVWLDAPHITKNHLSQCQLILSEMWAIWCSKTLILCSGSMLMCYLASVCLSVSVLMSVVRGTDHCFNPLHEA